MNFNGSHCAGTYPDDTWFYGDSSTCGNFFNTGSSYATTNTWYVWEKPTREAIEKPYRPGYVPVMARDKAKIHVDLQAILRHSNPKPLTRKPDKQELKISRARRYRGRR